MTFYTVVPTIPPTFAVQPNSPQISEMAAAELLCALERYFMSAVVLVSWDAAGAFRCHGPHIAEDLVTCEELVWREFELPGEPEIPF